MSDEADKPAGASARATAVNAGLGDLAPGGADDAPDKAKGGALSRTAAVARIHPPITSGCWDCGRSWAEPGWVDAWIPDDLWQQIAPHRDGRGHLCIHCITAALTAIGALDVPVTLWAPPYNRGGPV